MKKNESVNCRVNPITRTITISKPFAKAAGKVGTAEYDELMRAMSDHPGYTVELRCIKKKEGKKSYRNLTYENMREYIINIIDDEKTRAAAIATFEKIKAFSKIQPGAYAYVKNWFLNTYPDYKETEMVG